MDPSDESGCIVDVAGTSSLAGCRHGRAGESVGAPTPLQQAFQHNDDRAKGVELMSLTEMVRDGIENQEAHQSAAMRGLTSARRARAAPIACVGTLALVGLVLLFPGRALAQAPPAFTPSANPVSDAVRTLLARESKNLVASAELMPAEKYTFQPTPAQMTFGQLVAHIVQTNVVICSGIGSTPSPMTPEELKKLSGTDPKEALVAAIKRSFDYCSESLTKVQDSTLGEEISMFGRKAGQSRAAAMITIATDWTDHYSTAASYLRLSGILPPTAQPKK
jgi:hypothetical protein